MPNLAKKMRRAILPGNSTKELRNFDVPVPGHGEVLIKTKSSKTLRIHPAILRIRWAIQRGQIPIPFSVNRNHYLSKLHAAVMPSLSNEDMNSMASINRQCRLIKGQVFLWRDGQTWGHFTAGSKYP